MGFETPQPQINPQPQELPKEPEADQEKLDSKWYGRMVEFGAFEDYELLEIPKAEKERQREAFLQGDIRNPSFHYPKITDKFLEAKYSGLMELKRDMVAEEDDRYVLSAYRKKANQKMGELHMLDAARRGDVRNYERLNEFVYGKLDREIFSFFSAQMRRSASHYLNDSDPELRAASQEMLDVFPDETSTLSGVLTDQKRESIKKQVLVELEEVFKVNFPKNAEGKEDDVTFLTYEQVRESFEGVFRMMKAEEFGWSIEETDQPNVSVSQDSKKVRIPKKELFESGQVKIGSRRVKQLIAHELLTHTSKRIFGEQSRLMLLGLGFDRYLSGEEGTTTMKEMAFEERDVYKDEVGGSYNYLMVGLAHGFPAQYDADTGKELKAAIPPRDFRDMYDIMVKIAKWGLLREKKVDKAYREKRAPLVSWDNAVRLFRGGDPNTPGAVSLKDQVYGKGNVEVLMSLPETGEYGIPFGLNQLGKFRFADPGHREIIEELGLMTFAKQDIQDEDLQELGQLEVPKNG